MKSEKKVVIQEKEVLMRYCAAAETGYEELSGKSSTRFIPAIDPNGNRIPAEATTIDYIYLAVSSIVAAYAVRHQDPPITVEQILYEVSPEEIGTLIKSVVDLRAIWYEVPSVMNDNNKDEDTPKNV